MTWGATIHKKPTKPWKEKCFLQRPKLEIDSVSRLVECNVQISLALIWIDKFFLSYVIIFCSKICCFLGLFLFVICAIISEVYWGFKIASPQRYFGVILWCFAKWQTSQENKFGFLILKMLIDKCLSTEGLGDVAA